MSDAPSESWLRDALFEYPWDLLREAFEDFGDDVVPTVNRWKEFHTNAGRIDLLFAYAGRLVVVEVKRVVIDEGAVAQCLRYIGAIKDEFWRLSSEEDVDVSGIVAAPTITDGARYAASAANIVFARLKPAVDIAIDDKIPQFVENRRRLECQLTDMICPGQRMERDRTIEIAAQLRRQGFVRSQITASHDL